MNDETITDERRAGKRSRWPAIGACWIALLAIAHSAIAQDRSDPSPSDIGRAAQGFLRQGQRARALATLNARELLFADDPRITRMRLQLDLLQRGYKNTEEEIVALTISYVGQIRNAGGECTIEEFLNGMFDIHPDRKEGPPKGEDFLSMGAIYMATIMRLDKEAATTGAKQSGARPNSTAVEVTPEFVKPPTHNIKAERLYNEGRAMEKLRKRTLAVRVYQNIIQEYPGTNESLKAAERLRSLNPQGSRR